MFIGPGVGFVLGFIEYVRSLRVLINTMAVTRRMLWRRDHGEKNAGEIAKDPVCGMQADLRTAEYRVLTEKALLLLFGLRACV